MDDAEASHLASDDERKEVVDRLHSAVDEGRITVSGFDERSQRAYAATTRGELEQLTTDLPAPAQPQQEVDRPDRRKSMVQPVPVLAMSAFVILLWGVASLATGSLMFFWPIFPIGVGGIGLAAGAFYRRRGKPES